MGFSLRVVFIRLHAHSINDSMPFHFKKWWIFTQTHLFSGVLSIWPILLECAILLMICIPKITKFTEKFDEHDLKVSWKVFDFKGFLIWHFPNLWIPCCFLFYWIQYWFCARKKYLQNNIWICIKCEVLFKKLFKWKTFWWWWISIV